MDEVLGARRRGRERRCVRDALHAGVAGAQQLVGAILDPPRDVGVGRAAVGRVVLEAAVLRRIVRRRDDDAVGEVPAAAAVVDEDRARDRPASGVKPSSRWITVSTPLAASTSSAVRCAGSGQRMRVLAHEQRPVDALFAPVVADRLRDRQDVRLGERAARASEPRWPLVPKLTCCAGSSASGLRLEVRALERRDVDQQLLRSRLAGERRNGQAEFQVRVQTLRGSQVRAPRAAKITTAGGPVAGTPFLPR